jgi:hypothetical protein
MAAAACEASKGEFVPAESDGVVYLDSAGKTQLPLSVLEVGEKALKRKVTIVQSVCIPHVPTIAVTLWQACLTHSVVKPHARTRFSLTSLSLISLASWWPAHPRHSSH